MSEYRLSVEIISESSANIWDEAKLEWSLFEVYEDEEFDTCLCGHYPIKEICILTNKRNGNKAKVGNCCVKKFVGLPSHLIFQAVKRIRGDNEKPLNAEAVEHAYSKGWINEWERDFSFSTMRKQKRTMSAKQITTRKNINKKMLRNMRRRPN